MPLDDHDDSLDNTTASISSCTLKTVQMNSLWQSARNQGIL